MLKSKCLKIWGKRFISVNLCTIQQNLFKNLIFCLKLKWCKWGSQTKSDINIMVLRCCELWAHSEDTIFMPFLKSDIFLTKFPFCYFFPFLIFFVVKCQSVHYQPVTIPPSLWPSSCIEVFWVILRLLLPVPVYLVFLPHTEWCVRFIY